MEYRTSLGGLTPPLQVDVIGRGKKKIYKK